MAHYLASAYYAVLYNFFLLELAIQWYECRVCWCISYLQMEIYLNKVAMMVVKPYCALCAQSFTFINCLLVLLLAVLVMLVEVYCLNILSSCFISILFACLSITFPLSYLSSYSYSSLLLSVHSAWADWRPWSTSANILLTRALTIDIQNIWIHFSHMQRFISFHSPNNICIFQPWLIIYLANIW